MLLRSLAISGTLLLTGLHASAQQLPAYAVFTGTGKPLAHKKMMKQLQQADIILFGELHDNAIGHWLQLEVT